MVKYTKSQLNARRPRIPFTKEGYEKVVAEKQELLERRPEAVRRLADARSMGDLSENGYYKAARAELSSIDARLRRVDRLVRFGVIVNTFASDTVQIGSRVKISDGAREFEYVIVGGYESNPSAGTISYKSPIGSSLMGRRVGDAVEVSVPAGMKSYTILTIT